MYYPAQNKTENPDLSSDFVRFQICQYQEADPSFLGKTKGHKDSRCTWMSANLERARNSQRVDVGRIINCDPAPACACLGGIKFQARVVSPWFLMITRLEHR